MKWQATEEVIRYDQHDVQVGTFAQNILGDE